MPSGDLADLFDPGLTNLDQFAKRVPFDTFDRLRQEAPVYWHPEAPPNHGFWAVTRHDDVDRVHHDVKTYSSEVGAVSIEELDAEQLETRKSMIDMDAPGHTQLRGTVNHRFTPRAVGAYMDQLRNLTRETLDRALAKERFDFVDEISRRVPVSMLWTTRGAYSVASRCRSSGSPRSIAARVAWYSSTLPALMRR